MPPIGFLPGQTDGMGVRVLIDKCVRSLGSTCCVLVGGGSPDVVLKISVDNLLHAIANENAKHDMGDTETAHDLCRCNNDPAPADLQSTIMNLSNPGNPVSTLRLACDSTLARAGEFFDV